MIDWFHTFVCIVNLGIKNYCLVPGIWDSPPTSHSWNLWCNVQPGRNWVSHWCLCLSADVWLVYASFVVLAVDTGLLMVLIASFLIRASLKCDPSKWMNKSAWAWSVESSGDWKLNQPHASTQTLSVSCSTTPRGPLSFHTSCRSSCLQSTISKSTHDFPMRNSETREHSNKARGIWETAVRNPYQPALRDHFNAWCYR